MELEIIKQISEQQSKLFSEISIFQKILGKNISIIDKNSRICPILV